MTITRAANRAASHIGRTSIGLAVVMAAGCSSPAKDDRVAITNVNVITMVGDEILFDHTVLVAGGHILTVGPAGSIDVPKGVLELDGRGSYLIPGLWDMHTHIFGPTMESDLFPTLLAHGVTGVRDMNGTISLDSIQRLKANINDGSVLGPTIVAPGPLIDAPGRSPDEMSPAIREIDSPEAARSTVHELASLGADFIKLYNRLTVPLLDALLQEADAAGIPVVGHVPMAMAASRMSATGMTSQEHLQGILEESSGAGDEFREFVDAGSRQYSRPSCIGRPALN